MDSPYSLREPLPASVFGKSSVGIAGYRNFSVFSWPWLWRRSLIFGPIALLLGTNGGINVWLQTKDLELGMSVIRIALPAWLAIMLLGPALATLARYMALRARSEKTAVLVAILVGMGVSMIGQLAAEDVVRESVLPRLIEEGFATGRSSTLSNQPVIRSINRFIQLSLFFALGGGLGLRRYFAEQRVWREYQQERELVNLRAQRDDADRRLTVLQAQVEPHFLFNTLASVRSLIKTEPDRAEATIDALVDHLRATLPKMRNDSVSMQSTLTEQVEICRSYLEVMRVRMGGRFSYRIDVSDQLRSLAFPQLILISLVENAIKHGVEPKVGPCTVTITAAKVGAQTGESLEVSVIDNGAGLKPGLGTGLGLANIRAQLATRFGERASLRLGSLAQGVIATVTVPVEGPVA